jgi:hypothetical protein
MDFNYIEFDLTEQQADDIPPPEGKQCLLVGSIQRRSFPDEPRLYFRGRYLDGKQVARLRRAANPKPRKRAPTINAAAVSQPEQIDDTRQMKRS